MGLPALKLKPVPPVRVAKQAADLYQFLATDLADIQRSGTEWVRDMASRKDAEALRAGNPSVRPILINGTIGANGARFTGFQPGSIEAANNSVKITYLGGQLADLANRIQPILQAVISETFPDSKNKRLARAWEWRVQYRSTPGGKGRWSVPVGKRVPQNIGIYDVLWLFPKDPSPSDYAWFANYHAKKRFGYKYNLTRKTIHEFNKATKAVTKRKVVRLKKRMVGYAGETSRRARGAKAPGLHVSAMVVQNPLLAGGSKSRYGVPVIRVAFRPSLTVSVPP